MLHDVKIEEHVVAPYKKPYSLIPGNEEFNNHVSMVRIRSEHAIGFLKVYVSTSRTNRRTNLRLIGLPPAWACVHSFAMQSEADERGPDSDDDVVMADPFIQEWLSSSSDSEANVAPVATRVHAGQAKREDLKHHLFRAKARRKRHRARRQREELGMNSDSGEE
ncbi:hypothetical protein C8R44DRAFT_888449 [Mycena epipterygia]|nr:hypothetical protein C8R44DRAFT_888449 [Mycena epipterygia]